VFAASDEHTGPQTLSALVELLTGNETLTALSADCDETAASTAVPPFASLAQAIRSNPRSALTTLNLLQCAATPSGAGRSCR
jgi:hypothetical protein